MNCLTEKDLINEFDRQVKNLIEKGYPEILNKSSEQFNDLISPLKQKLKTVTLFDKNLETGYLPFVIVVKSNLIDSETQMSKITKDGKTGITKLFPHTSANFKTIDSVNLPETDFYLLLDIDRGKENINLPPNKALQIIISKNRSPLTIEEGIAIVTHFPEFLIKNNCFSLLASRTGNDQRVPAIWINSNKEPNLGWCWDGNPHTWLGSASCDKRI